MTFDSRFAVIKMVDAPVGVAAGKGCENMPFYELLLHLRLTGDAIYWRADGKIMTNRGHKYIESREGIELFCGRWVYKTIWCRS
jgi:hypothetical protein